MSELAATLSQPPPPPRKQGVFVQTHMPIQHAMRSSIDYFPCFYERGLHFEIQIESLCSTFITSPPKIPAGADTNDTFPHSGTIHRVFYFFSV